MLTIAAAAYNVISMGFSWKQNIRNWINFLDGSGEIVIAVNTSKDDTLKELREFFAAERLTLPAWSSLVFNVIETNFPYDDPEFDGKIKNAAFKAATMPVVLALDLDEILPLKNKHAWDDARRSLIYTYDFDGFIIPSVDLCKSWETCKSVGQKFYLVKSRPNISRGVPKFARKEDGSIDITKSDTTEFILENGELAKFGSLINPNYAEAQRLGEIQSGRIPFVLHLGWLDREQRMRQSKFWKPVWENRAKSEVKDVIDTPEMFDSIEVKSHGLGRMF